ncbi:hypothetical protein [Paraburkholderia sp.]|uniref:hypothetical protein n=1 Tax=Paraburkholderia sp. TaxID=1926495 RepID=UPI003C7A9588
MRILAKLTQNPWQTVVLGAIGTVIVVIAIAVAGGEVTAGVLKFSFKGILNQKPPDLTNPPPAPEKQGYERSPSSDTFANVPQAVAQPIALEQLQPQVTAPLVQPAPIPAATSELAVPLGRSEVEAMKLLDGVKYAWKVSEGGMTLEYMQDAFGSINWNVEERFVGNRATSATLTLDTQAAEVANLMSSNWSKQFKTVHDLCYGRRYLAMKRDWDNNMQLIDGKIDPDEIDVSQRINVDETPPCPSASDCELGTWYSQRADLTYKVPNLWYVFVSMQKSSFVRDQGPDEHRRFTYRRDRCAAKVTYSLDGSARPSQVELLP